MQYQVNALDLVADIEPIVIGLPLCPAKNSSLEYVILCRFWFVPQSTAFSSLSAIRHFTRLLTDSMHAWKACIRLKIYCKTEMVDECHYNTATDFRILSRILDNLESRRADWML